MKRRILTALLAVCLVFALGTIGAFADEEKVVTADMTTLQSGNYIVNTDITLTDGPITIANESVVTLTIAEGATLTNKAGEDTIVVNYGGELILNGPGKVDNVSHAKAALYNNGTVTINNACRLDRSQETGVNADVSGGNSYYVILNHGIMTINNAIINQDGGFSSMIDNGYSKYESTDSRNGYVVDVNHPHPSLTIEGGSFSGGLNTVKNDDGATLVINNGSFSNVSQAVIQNHNVATINGGVFTGADSKDPIYGIDNCGCAAGNDLGTLTITGGTISNVTYGVLDRSTETPNVNISNVSIDAREYSVVHTVNSEAVINITSGTFTVNGEADTTVTRYLSDDTTLVVDPDTGEIVNNTETTVATVNGIGYSDLQTAINAAETGETVVLQDDVEVDLTGTAPNTGKFNVSTNGIIIDGNNKTITVTASSANTLVINVGADDVVIKNLTIDGGGHSKHGVNVFQSDDVELINVTSKNNTGNGVVVNGSSVTAENLKTSGNGWDGVNVDPRDTQSASLTLSGANTSISDGIKIDNLATGKTATVSISNGYVSGIVEDDKNVGTTNVNVSGGTYGMSIKDVADDHPDYQVQSGNYYSYYDDIDAALAAAGAGDVVTYVGGTSATTTYTVTFNLYGTNYYTVTVPAGTEITLPRESYGSYYLAGWKCGGVTYAVGQKVPVNGPMTFTAIWKNGQYDIVIDATMKHGDIYTNVSSADAGEYVQISVDPDLGYKLKSLTVYVSLNNKVTVYTASAISPYDYYFVMPGATVFVTATFEVDGMPFVDVRPYQWHYDAIYYAWSNGLMEGLSDYIFEPDGDMTRAMFWAVLGRIDGKDITGINWVSQARSWAMANGVSDGTDPNGKITREQMVTMLWRFLDKPTGTAYLSVYSDANTISSWAKDAMAWALDEGIIKGITSTTIVPRGTATRAQCATIFMRAEID